MVDLASISAALSSLNIASKFLKNRLKQINDSAVREKLEELLNAIIPLQSQIIALQAANSAYIKEKEEIEKKLREIEDWKKESDRYERKEFALGVYVYAIKVNSGYSGLEHNVCPKCFEIDRKISTIQLLHESAGGKVYFCPNCKNEFNTRHKTSSRT
jgi:ribosomal protein L32